MNGPSLLIARVLGFAALATLAAMALSLGTVGSADDGKHPVSASQTPADPLWPEHLRCLILGENAESDALCRLILTVQPIDGRPMLGESHDGVVAGATKQIVPHPTPTKGVR